jgi:hypothetical protein
MLKFETCNRMCEPQIYFGDGTAHITLWRPMKTDHTFVALHYITYVWCMIWFGIHLWWVQSSRFSPESLEHDRVVLSCLVVLTSLIALSLWLTDNHTLDSLVLVCQCMWCCSSFASKANFHTYFVSLFSRDLFIDSLYFTCIVNIIFVSSIVTVFISNVWWISYIVLMVVFQVDLIMYLKCGRWLLWYIFFST